MKNSWRAFWEKLKNPPVWVHVVTYLLSLLFAVGSILCLLIDEENDLFLAALVYVVFALAALSLTYAVYLIVLHAKTFKDAVFRFLHAHDFTDMLLRDYGFRSIVTAGVSLLMSVVFGCFNAYMGISLRSVWYGALAAYYVFLVLIRGGILLYHKKADRYRGAENKREKQIGTYVRCGVIMLVLNVALSSAIAQMIFDDRHFSYAGWIIYGYAAYAFYKITMAIVNLFRAKKQDDLTIQALRNVNMIDAGVSILALQTALLTTFSSADVNVSLFNTLTGCAVSLLAIGLSIYMIANGRKISKEEKTQGENTHV